MARFVFRVGVGLVGADMTEEFEIDDEELEGAGDARDTLIHDYWREWAMQCLDGGYEEIGR
jgi:hypothetical protein